MKDYYTVPIYIRPDDAVILVYPGGMMMAKVKGVQRADKNIDRLCNALDSS